MSVVTRVPEPNIWDEICKDFESMKPSLRDTDAESVKTDRLDYDPSKLSPIFYGKMASKVNADSDPTEEFDSARSHPALVGYSLVDKPPASPPPSPPSPPNKKTCSPREYLEFYIFPVLLPAMEKMLEQAKLERCFERKRTKFNALDFLTEHLYKNNQGHHNREDVILWDIPFVKEWHKDHSTLAIEIPTLPGLLCILDNYTLRLQVSPRPPLPKSLLWSEEEATLIIQAYWRAFKVRVIPEVAELRTWQNEWRTENENISRKVNEFWDRQMPNNSQATPNASEEEIVDSTKPIIVKSPAPLK